MIPLFEDFRIIKLNEGHLNGAFNGGFRKVFIILLKNELSNKNRIIYETNSDSINYHMGIMKN